ncbi:DUF3667 domain-containing protein [Puia sp.]|uniref:DUF3667 domain-containing protein n=1 Tax=Puia sp. TaxID=2045100 RepID=UPI002F3F33BB
MSRHHLRHDKTCLNCGATVEDRFCTRCGQENLEAKESVGHIVGHFFADITHFDSKLFITLKDLLFRPGFLTREYVAGRRMTYLNPIRMYIFISAMFFLALFSGRKEHKPDQGDHQQALNSYRQHLADSLRAAAPDSVRGTVNRELAARLDTANDKKSKDESLNLTMGFGEVIIDMSEYKYNNIHEFDSVQRTLPDSAKEKGTMRWILRHNIEQKERRGTARIHIAIDISHDIPKLMFVLLPLFALYVGWFYSRKTYFYVNHAIFSVHYHSFVFLLFGFFLLPGKLIPGEWTEIIFAVLSLILAFVYLVAALHGMYRQSFWLTLFKGLGIALLYFVTLALASTLLMIGAYIWL